MELSIIIVNYNTKKLVLKCVDSILKTNPKCKFEIIVVDNGSTDGSSELLSQIRGSKLRIILHKKNVGFARGNNSAIKRAFGQYILLLNSDTQVHRGTIDNLLEFAKHTPNVGIAAPKLLNTDGTVQGSVFRQPTIRRAIRQYWLLQKGQMDKYSPHVTHPIEVEAVVAAAMLITPAARVKVGMFDERYFMYFEDLDYCRRVREAGLKIYYVPQSEVVHIHGASGKGAVISDASQWRRLIPSSKIYHGYFKHMILTFILWTGGKWLKLLGRS
jgi:GT2 family glycosyltransferase